MTEKEIRERLKNDFYHYAHKALVIRTKEEGNKPFRLNDAQKYIHERIEEQLKKTGKVRAIVLKGRQQGCSTYVEGRFYWKVSHLFGVRAFILTHDQDATNNLFEMVQRYHENCPEIIRPSAGSLNAKELLFDSLDSGYKVGTAGNKAVGRSSTVQFFHGSEVAFWPNAHEHAKGLLQAIPDADGTEIILESTANGVGNYFHSQWELAISGESGFIPIFVPWFWQKEYRKDLPEDFELDEDEMELRSLYSLNDEQIYWRRQKINDLSVSGVDGLHSFRQEYPCNSEEAFQASGIDSLIPSDYVVKAMKATEVPYGAKVMGVDPAWAGRDRSSIIFRQGRVAYGLQSSPHTHDLMGLTGTIYNLIKKEEPDKIFIDVGGGLGAGIVDRLKEMGVDNVQGINNASQAMESDVYANKRAEIWCLMKKWLLEENVDIPHSESLHKDLCGPTVRQPDSKGRIILEKKQDMEKRGVRSPDEADALSLTFAFPVRMKHANINSLLNPNVRI